MIRTIAKTLLTALYPDDSNCLVLDIEDIVVFVGQNRLAELGAVSAEELIGLKMQNILAMKQSQEGINYFRDMEQLKQKAYQDPLNPVRVIVSAPFENGRILHFTEVRSMYDENKSVIGCVIEAKNFSLSKHTTLNKLVKLTLRQEEIMFLLTIGFSQKEIADVYGVQRGTIIKNMGLICDKFGVRGASATKLVKLVYEHGYGIPPYHLLKTGIFEIPSPFITTEFFRSILI